MQLWSQKSAWLRRHGIGVESFMDVGVAGLHRLLAVLPELENAKVLIACAGMEELCPRC